MDKLLKKMVWFIFLIPAAYLAIVWKNIPITVPMHYNLQGDIDRYGNKNELLTLTAVLTALSIGVYLLVINIYRIDPKKNASLNRSRLLRMGVAISLFMTVILSLLIYNSMHNDPKFFMRLIIAAVGLLFCFLGNYMFSIKPNYFAGIRLPWTLENEENWRKTHQLGGKLFFSGGVLITLVSFLVPTMALYGVFTGITIAVTLIPCIYSFLLYRKQKNLSGTNQ